MKNEVNRARRAKKQKCIVVDRELADAQPYKLSEAETAVYFSLIAQSRVMSRHIKEFNVEKFGRWVHRPNLLHNFIIPGKVYNKLYGEIVDRLMKKGLVDYYSGCWYFIQSQDWWTISDNPQMIDDEKNVAIPLEEILRFL